MTRLVELLKCKKSVLGIVLFVLWGGWWYASFQNFVLWPFPFVQMTVPAWRFLGLDFMHNWLAVNFLLDGNDPYLHLFGDSRGVYSYPPIVLYLHIWVGLFSFVTAAKIGSISVSFITALTLYLGLENKKKRDGVSTNYILSLGLVLWSVPVIFAMERGNCDALVLLFVVFAYILYRLDSNWKRDFLLGLCIATAVWIKIYPIVLLPGLLFMKERRVFLFSLLGMLLIALAFLQGTYEFFQYGLSARISTGPIKDATNIINGNGSAHQIVFDFEYFNHSLSTFWGYLSCDVWNPIAKIPGVIAAALLLGLPAVYLGIQVYKQSHATIANFRLELFLWLLSAATYWMPMSYDYNLIYFPVLLILLLNPQISKFYNCLILLQVVWLLPVFIEIPVIAFVGIKYLGILCTAGLIYNRINQPLNNEPHIAVSTVTP